MQYLRQLRLDPTTTAGELLRSLREARGITQTQVAQAMGINQPDVSRIERQDDLYFSTFRAYLEALDGDAEVIYRGGKLRAVARLTARRKAEA